MDLVQSVFRTALAAMAVTSACAPGSSDQTSSGFVQSSGGSSGRAGSGGSSGSQAGGSSATGGSSTSATGGSGNGAGFGGTNDGGPAGTSGSAGTIGGGGSTSSTTGGAGGSSGTGGATLIGGPTIAGCPMFPADNPWNRNVSGDPVDPNSDAIIANILANGAAYLHPDFGSNLGYGIPYVVVPGTQPKVPVTFQYSGDSDPGPYPIPPDAPIEGGASSTGDRHVLVVDQDACLLYETWSSYPVNGGTSWQCGSGAIFDLRSDALRPDCWTSSDAAGLPVLPGLVRYDEAVVSGKIEHALRFTVVRTRQAFVHPGTHFASSQTGSDYPPMGMRVRLKASFDTSTFTGAARVILVALQTYGMFVADNGSNWYITGASDTRFDDNNLSTLKSVPGSAFEVVQMGRVYTPTDCP